MTAPTGKEGSRRSSYYRVGAWLSRPSSVVYGGGSARHFADSFFLALFSRADDAGSAGSNAYGGLEDDDQAMSGAHGIRVNRRFVVVFGGNVCCLQGA